MVSKSIATKKPRMRWKLDINGLSSKLKSWNPRHQGRLEKLGAWLAWDRGTKVDD
jgi:hypothetical protein